MENKTEEPKISMELLFVLLTIAGIIVMSVMIVNGEPSTSQMQAYAEQTQEKVVGIYPNEMTDKKSDFFIVTEHDGTHYVDVQVDNKELSHSSTKVAKDSGLMEMSQASIELVQEEAQAKLNKPNKSTRLMFLPMIR